MTKSASVIALSAVAVLVAAWLVYQRSEPAIPAPPETHIALPGASATGTASTVAPAALPIDNATTPNAPPVAEEGDGITEEAKEIFAAFDRGVTPTFVEYLTSKGLSREDSEKIVADTVRDMTTCLADAIRAQTSATEVLLKVAAGNPAVALPAPFLSEGAPSCMSSVGQRMGLPPNVKFEVRAQNSTFEFAARLPE
jgi:hypothetical protein